MDGQVDAYIRAQDKARELDELKKAEKLKAKSTVKPDQKDLDRFSRLERIYLDNETGTARIRELIEFSNELTKDIEVLEKMAGQSYDELSLRDSGPFRNVELHDTQLRKHVLVIACSSTRYQLATVEQLLREEAKGAFGLAEPRDPEERRQAEARMNLRETFGHYEEPKPDGTK